MCTFLFDEATTNKMSQNGDDDEETKPSSVLTPRQMTENGLREAQYSWRRIRGTKSPKTNVNRFRSHYGINPLEAIIVWEDLQTTEIEEAFLPEKDRNVKWFLMTLNFLKRYDTEDEREAKFDVSKFWGREKCWYMVKKIQGMKEQKILWPESNTSDDDDVWEISVDGIHSAIQEPQHPEFSQDTEYFSHKHGRAGLDYELGLLLNKNQLCWMYGPHRAGQNDLTIFTRKLELELRIRGKKAIGDGGYGGHQDTIVTPNPHDDKHVRHFKSRALKRHEKFNGYVKSFACTSERFRHTHDKFKACFEAVCVLCQYKIENSMPLYNILVEGLFDDVEGI